MKTAERILGFASCALGLLPIMGDAVKAQQMAPVACQAFGNATAGANQQLPLATPPGNQRVLICGYSIAVNAANVTSASANILVGFGTACVTGGGITQTIISPSVPVGSSLSMNGMAMLLPPGANVCLNGNGGTTTATAELSYSLQ